jgi:hypothetical protein
MQTLFCNSAAASVAVLAFALGPIWAHADTLPGLTNLDFAFYKGVAPKASFSAVDPTGWTANPDTVTGIATTFIAHPCTGACVPGQPGDESAASPLAPITTYANPTDLTPSVFKSALSNYVVANGDANTDSGFQSATLTGLTAGKTYELTFYQGASQEVGFSGASNDQWVVALSTSGLQVSCPGGPSPGPCTYSSSDKNASIKTSPLMNVPTGSVDGWEPVTLYLTADSTSEKLSFLAWGNQGEQNLTVPPVLFLTGIDADLPEPSTWAMMIVGFLGIGGVAWRRSRRAALAAQTSKV